MQWRVKIMLGRPDCDDSRMGRAIRKRTIDERSSREAKQRLGMRRRMASGLLRS